MTERIIQARTSGRLALLVLCFAMSGWSFAQGVAGMEPAPAFPAITLADPALLSGPFHKVDASVRVEGDLGRFAIDSKFGRFPVHGASLLAVRVSELHAIDELRKVEKSAAFADALEKSVSGVAKFAERAVTDPGKTVENVGKGVGTLLGRIGQMAESGANFIGDKAGDIAAPGAKPDARLSPTGEPEPPSFTGDPLGYNKARREWARKLHIDPYTSNPVLRALLDDAASASFAGNFAVNLTIGAVAAPIQYAYSIDAAVSNAVWSKPAIDLEIENQEKLLSLGVAARTARDLFRNRWFTPTLQTALVSRLAVLGRLDGIESVVRTAASTLGESRARFLLESLAVLATHHRKVAPLVKIRTHDNVPYGVESGGEVVAALAIDYGVWNRDGAAFALRNMLGNASGTLLVVGNLSPWSASELERSGWKIKTGVRL